MTRHGASDLCERSCDRFAIVLRSVRSKVEICSFHLQVRHTIGVEMRTHRAWSAGVLVAAITVAVAACGSSGGGSATLAPSAAAGGATSIAPTSGGGASSAPAGAGGGSGSVDVCQVVGQAVVAPFFTTAMTATEDTSQTGEASACIYQVSPHDGLAPMQILAVNGDQAAATFANYTGGNEGAVPLPGIGDKAVHSPGQASFEAIKGSTFCAVSLGAGNNTHYAGMPSPDANGNLSDAAAVAYAQQLAPLCAMIFAATGAH
jgi:hypothetical protein